MEPFSYQSVTAGTSIPAVINVIVEIPKGCRNKYEVDKKAGLMRLDRYLFSSSHYPGDYGFIPQTLAEDGDALDALVMVNEPTFSGCLIEARVLGLFRMKDRGKNDYKVLGVPHRDPLFCRVEGFGRCAAALPARGGAFLRDVQAAGGGED
jgi:inorganic pyrophosphatase